MPTSFALPEKCFASGAIVACAVVFAAAAAAVVMVALIASALVRQVYYAVVGQPVPLPARLDAPRQPYAGLPLRAAHAQAD